MKIFPSESWGYSDCQLKECGLFLGEVRNGSLTSSRRSWFFFRDMHRTHNNETSQGLGQPLGGIFTPCAGPYTEIYQRIYYASSFYAGFSRDSLGTFQINRRNGRSFGLPWGGLAQLLRAASWYCNLVPNQYSWMIGNFTSSAFFNIGFPARYAGGTPQIQQT